MQIHEQALYFFVRIEKFINLVNQRYWIDKPIQNSARLARYLETLARAARENWLFALTK